ERGTPLVGRAEEFLIEAKNFRKMAYDFGDADDGQIFGINYDVAAGGSHALASGAEKGERRIAAAQRFDQLRAVHFARGFAGGDEDLHVGIVNACVPTTRQTSGKINAESKKLLCGKHRARGQDD